MTDSFLMRLCTERYDRKPFEQIKLQILTCCVEQQRHQDFSEVRRIAAPNCHTKYKRPRQTIKHALDGRGVFRFEVTYHNVPLPYPQRNLKSGNVGPKLIEHLY